MFMFKAILLCAFVAAGWAIYKDYKNNVSNTNEEVEEDNNDE